MRISDWSSDVCSSDLLGRIGGGRSNGLQLNPGLGKRFINFVTDGGGRIDLLRGLPGDRSLRLRAALAGLGLDVIAQCLQRGALQTADGFCGGILARALGSKIIDCCFALTNMMDTCSRSEEHTSELQSLMRISYDVFCLRKKTNTRVVRNKK